MMNNLVKSNNKKSYYDYMADLTEVENDSIFRYVVDLEEENIELKSEILSLKKLLNDNKEEKEVKDYPFLKNKNNGKGFKHYDKVVLIRHLYEFHKFSYTKIGYILGLDYRVVSNVINRRYNKTTNEKIDELWDSYSINIGNLAFGMY